MPVSLRPFITKREERVIPFEAATLANGLRVVVHRDVETPLVAVNVLYRVGSRDDPPQRTGLAHLFEHLMFGGSAHVPDFDEAIQMAGGENNAFTNADATNYYDTLPAAHLEVALWLESDRMCCLGLGEEVLEVQRSVVIEEFREANFGEPWGDAWHHLLGLAWNAHPYRWPTIGLSEAHLRAITRDDARRFYETFYRPSNATLVIAGNVDPDEALRLADTWFGDIASGPPPERRLPVEVPGGPRRGEVRGHAPVDALFLAWHMPPRDHPDYHTIDLISDLLDNGPSARLYRRLIKEKHLASFVDCYLSSHVGPGLFVIEARPANGVRIETLERALREEVERLCAEPVPERELQKVRNKAEATLLFGEIQVLHKALNLAFFDMLGDVSLIQREHLNYRRVQVEDMRRVARSLFRPENEVVLYYRAGAAVAG